MTARAAALDVFARSHAREGFASELVDDVLAKSSLSLVDRRFVTQLVFGTIRRRATLDALVRPFVQRPFHDVEPALQDILRLGAYQIAFLTHVPRHAAVHETVELANHIGNPRAKGFINGVLRRVSEVVTDEFVPSPAADAFAVDAVEDPQRKFRKLGKPLLPDPAAQPAGYLAAAFSWPRWLADRWLERFGAEECHRLGFWFNSPPPLWIRSNALRTDREGLRLRLAAETIPVETGPHPQSLQILGNHAVRELPGFADGDFAVQDLSSMAVASALAPEPGWRVLDLCSAPGGKTTHLAELMRNRGQIVACDIEKRRLDTVTALCHRLGVTIVEPHLLDKESTEPPACQYDAALVDVPCSNTGVLGRRPEVRWRIHPSEFEHLIRLQTRLLFTAIDRVRPGGVILYSTCSIEPDENEGVIHAVRRGIRSLVVEAEGHAIPGSPADGGYWARLRKSS